MSTFLGLIEEIPGISVDYFCNENLDSSAFFLTHCHTDHMKGLDYKFFQHLEYTNKYLYCSSVSKLFLENYLKLHELHRIKELTVDSSIVIDFKIQNGDEITVTVTCVPTGHCPGAVMFLFDYHEKSILYTGDFRIDPKNLIKLKSLHYIQGNRHIPKRFDKIYLDTTFLNSNFHYFPNRQESLKVICEVIKEWLDQDRENVVVLECSANYGSEFLFLEIAKSFNKKIHVKDYLYSSYCRILEVAPYITNDSLITPIHACVNKRHSLYGRLLTCREQVDVKNILTVVPSVLKWRTRNTAVVAEWDKLRPRTFNVCYSTHCSVQELKAFLQYFEADEIHPCVCNESEATAMNELLHSIRKKSAEKGLSNNGVITLEIPDYKLSERTVFKSKYFDDDDDDDDDSS